MVFDQIGGEVYRTLRDGMKKTLKRILWCGGVFVLVQIAVRLYLFFRPHITPPVVAPLLHHPIRRWYRDPRQTLALLRLQPGQQVLEIGGGTGMFTTDAAHQIRHGSLSTLDRQTPMLRNLAARVRCAHHPNVTIVQGDAQCLPYADCSFDRTFMIAVLPMVPGRYEALREVWRVLRPGGLLLISEEVLAPEYVPPFVTRWWASRAGFTVVDEQVGFWCYSVVVQKT